MNVKRRKFASALSFLEVLLAIASLAIVSIGALSYEYHVAGHTRIARAQMKGMRTAQLLLEDWKSTGGSEYYDVSMLGLSFTSGIPIPSDWTLYDELGEPLDNSVCSITIDRLPMLIILRWRDVDYDDTAEVILRQLSVIVRFGEIDESGDLVYSAGYLQRMRPIIMTTYTRIDASAG